MPRNFDPTGNAHTTGVALAMFYANEVIDNRLFNRSIFVAMEDIRLNAGDDLDLRQSSILALWNGLVLEMHRSYGMQSRATGREHIADATHRSFYYDAVKRAYGLATI